MRDIPFPFAWGKCGSGHKHGLGTLIFLSAALHFLIPKNSQPSVLQGSKTFVGTIALLLGFVIWQTLPAIFADPFQPMAIFETTISIPSKSIAPFGSILGVIRITSYVVFFLLILNLAQTSSFRRIFSYLIFGTVLVQALIALMSLRFLNGPIWGASQAAYPGAATGTFVGKNGLAAFLAMGLLFSVSSFLILPVKTETPIHANFDLRRTLVLIASLVVLAALLCTQSRMGILSAAVGTLVLIVKSPAKTILPITLGFAFVALGFGRKLLERFVDLSPDVLVRTNLYDQIVGMIQFRPWTGFGLDSFPQAFEIFHHPPVSSEVVWTKAHSTYLTLWVELGVLAGSIPIVLGLVIAARLWRAHRRNPNGMVIGALAALVVAGTHSIFDFSLEIPTNIFLLLAIVAIGWSEIGHNLPKFGSGTKPIKQTAGA